MVIFIILVAEYLIHIHGTRASPCDFKNEHDAYFKCLNKWRIIRDHLSGHAEFLRDVSLIDEICIDPDRTTIDDMDACVVRHVSPYCDGIHVHWKGLKEFTSFLCKRRDAFQGTYARCRKNRFFQLAYEKCMSIHSTEITSGGDQCRSYRKLDRCIEVALNRQCQTMAVEFFSLAFRLRDDPLIEFSCGRGSAPEDLNEELLMDDPASYHGNEETAKSELHVFEQVKIVYEEGPSSGSRVQCNVYQCVYQTVLMLLMGIIFTRSYNIW